MSLELFCRLCLTPGIEEYKYLQNDIGDCNEIYKITVKYFKPELLSEYNSTENSRENSILCQNCWVHIQDFHDFQQTVAKTRSSFQQININKKLSMQIKKEDEVSTMFNDCKMEIVGPFRIKVEEDANIDTDVDNIGIETDSSLNHIGMDPLPVNIKVEEFGMTRLCNDFGEEKRTSLDHISVMIKEEQFVPVSNANNYANAEVKPKEMFISEKQSHLGEKSDKETKTSWDHVSIMKSPLHIKLEEEQVPSLSEGQNHLEHFTEVYRSDEDDKSLLYTLKQSTDNDEVLCNRKDDSTKQYKFQSCYKDRSCTNKEDKKSEGKSDDFVDSLKDEGIESLGKGKKFDKFIAEWKPQLDCDICGETFSTFDLLKVHFNENHAGRFYVKCCDNKFYLRCRLVDHIRLHVNPEIHKCDICGKLSATKNNLIRHKRIIHEQSEKFPCSMCPRIFKLKHNLTSHMVTHKTGSKDFKCKQCERAYITETQLKKHVLSFHSEKKICDQCGKTLRDIASLKNHWKEHSGIEKRKYPCDECGAELGNPSTLKRHKISYHSDRSTVYVCSLCGKISSNERALKIHKKYVHEKERVHKCPQCDKAFKRRLNLQQHISIHTGEDRFQCSLCPLSFRHNTKYNEHRRKLHAIEYEQGSKNRIKQQKIDLEQVKNQVVL